MTTPDQITALADGQIFVFGSNLNGNHAGGAAKLAKDNFGALEGAVEGITGQSYAFPTLGKTMEKRIYQDLSVSAELLKETARENPEKVFFLTKVGCGIAGYEESYMKKFFEKNMPENIICPNW